MTHVPNIWGEGQLLAFSGLDGETKNLQPFVLHTAAAPGGLPWRRRARIPPPT